MNPEDWDSTKGNNTLSTPAPNNKAPMGSKELRPWGFFNSEKLTKGRGNQSQAKNNVKMPIGTFIKKVKRHPRSGPPNWISSPPNTGPIATDTPTVVPDTPKARPRSGPLKYCWIMPIPWGFTKPEPTPWI